MKDNGVIEGSNDQRIYSRLDASVILVLLNTARSHRSRCFDGMACYL
jgi:hypothetical protein